MNHVVTRFAPSPTGYLHIGGIRTALINYILTKQAKIKFPNSKFLLRIEDTDKIRSKNEFTKNILTALQWLNIKWDEKIIIQSERIEKHKKVSYELLKRNLAFKCICTPKQLEEKRLKNQKNHLNVKRLCTNCEKNSEIHNSEIQIPVSPDSQLFIKNSEIQKFRNST